MKKVPSRGGRDPPEPREPPAQRSPAECEQEDLGQGTHTSPLSGRTVPGDLPQGEVRPVDQAEQGPESFPLPAPTASSHSDLCQCPRPPQRAITERRLGKDQGDSSMPTTALPSRSSFLGLLSARARDPQGSHTSEKTSQAGVVGEPPGQRPRGLVPASPGWS